MARPPAPTPALPHDGIRWRTPRYLLSAPWEEDEIRRDRVEPQSVSLSWREPMPVGAPGANGTEYEIRYYEKVRRGSAGPRVALGSCGLSPRSCFLFYLLAAKALLTFL